MTFLCITRVHRTLPRRFSFLFQTTKRSLSKVRRRFGHCVREVLMLRWWALAMKKKKTSQAKLGNRKLLKSEAKRLTPSLTPLEVMKVRTRRVSTALQQVPHCFLFDCNQRRVKVWQLGNRHQNKQKRTKIARLSYPNQHGWIARMKSDLRLFHTTRILFMLEFLSFLRKATRANMVQPK